jgi:hypothetical protein
MKKMRKVTLAEVIAKASRNKAFQRALLPQPTKIKKVLAEEGLALSARDLNNLAALVSPVGPKPPGPPPPPPWQPTFILTSAILTALDARVAKIEKSMKRTGSRGRTSKR